MSLKKTIMTDDYSPFGSHYKRSQILNVVLWMSCLVIVLISSSVVGVRHYYLLVYIAPIIFIAWSHYDKNKGFTRYMQEKYG